MNYTDTIHWLFNKLPMYQTQGKSALKHKLDNIILLSEHLHNPEQTFKSIHVAGTNGKGSSSHMLASILQEAGYKVGLYTSPHLKDFRERIKVNGEPITEEYVVDFVEANKTFFETYELSFFEMTVGLAFDYFADEEVDVAVIEVGLGGRLDSTNIITPLVSLITNIGMDHTDILGDTLPKIAFEKAGIIKPKVPVVISEYHQETAPVFRQKAQECEAEIVFASELGQQKTYVSDLKGIYQKMNIAGVLAVADILQRSFSISEKAIETGLLNVVANTGLMGRWQQLGAKPKIICDTAHNAAGLQIAMEQLKQEEFEALHMVVGFVKDKNLEEILPLFPKNAIYYFTKPNNRRALEPKELIEKAAFFGLQGTVFSTVKAAYDAAVAAAGKDDFVYVGGSTFVVAEIV